MTIDWYHTNKKTSDLLYYFNLPYTTGYSSYLKNIGTLRNSGFEFALNTVNCVGEFKWNTSGNISFNKNKILDLNGVDLYINNDTYKIKIGNWAIIREGEQMGTFWGLVSDGIWQTADVDKAATYGAKPGDFKYIDQNNDGKIDVKDQGIIGHALPKFTWGLSNNFSYKSFSLDVFLQGSQGNQLLNSNRFELESGNGLTNASTKLLDRWTPENPNNLYARANRNSDYLHMSTRYLENGSYVRVKTVTLSYDLPQSLMKKLKITHVKVYVTAQNPITITKYSGFDPEVGSFGMDNTRLGYDYGSYPSVRTYIVGGSINF